MSGMGRNRTICVVGRGAELEVPVKFTPRYVRVIDVDDPLVWEKTEEMPGEQCLKWENHAAVQMTVIAAAGDGIKIETNKVTLHADVAQATHTLYILVLE